MNKEYNLTFHSDPGHGWLECPVILLNELNITDKISRYSYISRGLAYLEEDCDASVLIDALKARGDSVTFAEKNEPNNQSFIRRLTPFNKDYARQHNK